MIRILNSGSQKVSRCQASLAAFHRGGKLNECLPCGRSAGQLSAARPFSVFGFRGVEELFDNNDAWVRSVTKRDPKYFERLAEGQKPRYLWIGCSDSRTPPEVLCGMDPGTLFVHRNVANLINNVDVSCMSVLQYAVAVLKVEHIVVCGHYECGGVAASMENVDHKSPLENWLRNIRDVYRLHKDELDAIDSIDARKRRLVEINVIEQAMNLYKTTVVQARRIETYKNLDKYGFVQPRIHPCVHDLHTGLLHKLDERMREQVESLAHIYNMYSTEGDDNEEVTQWPAMGSSIITPDQMDQAFFNKD